MQRELNELEFLQYTFGQPNNIAMVITIIKKQNFEILNKNYLKTEF
ncbi:MAG: hypothetical protein ACFE8E_12765 [Candidatus Hodarchaeota archaeon]